MNDLWLQIKETFFFTENARETMRGTENALFLVDTKASKAVFP